MVVTPTIYHLILYQAGEDGLSRALANTISELLEAKITRPAETTQIDLWLDSPGGDAHAAYKIYLMIRSRSKIFRAIVPDYAKSAATLLVLGADEVLMGPSAELGPLDAQVEHPDREGKQVSALDAIGAVNYLVELATELALTTGPQFLRFTGLPRSEVLRELLRFMARFLDPMVAKLDPQLVHHARNDLRVAEEYAIRLLAGKQKRNGQKVRSSTDSKKLASRLVSKYPEHGFVISRDEAISLGLGIKNAESHPRWLQFKELNRITYAQHRETHLEIIEDSELDKDEKETPNDDKLPPDIA